MLGHIVKLNRSEGYAYVRPRSGPDVLIKGHNMPGDLRKGDVIEFSTCYSRGLQAVDVTKIM